MTNKGPIIILPHWQRSKVERQTLSVYVEMGRYRLRLHSQVNAFSTDY